MPYLKSSQITGLSPKRVDVTGFTQSAAEDLEGTYSQHEVLLADAFNVTDNVTISDNLILAKLSDDGNAITVTGNATTTRTISGSGSLEGSTFAQTPNASLTSMTGVLGSAVTGTLGSGVSGGSGLTALGTVASGTLGTNVAYESGAAPAWILTHFRDFSVTNGYFDIPVDANSTYKINFGGVCASGSNGYAVTIFASINGGSSFLSGSNGSGIDFNSTSTGAWNTFATNSDSARMNHNFQVDYGISGEVNFVTGPAGTGTAGIDYPLHYYGHTAYDSDNQGDAAVARVGGAFAAGSASNTINLFRFCGYLNGTHPNYRLSFNRGKVSVSKLNESVLAT